ncbi:hypothetical protein [Modicisalibacter coralii]|uniref:hypothetical protein n=1 Tax=Modicisalibacter coralii TaxID=2304602 RepID=UPI00100A6433|nr:hypothetical protein [Halomonas coralii]
MLPLARWVMRGTPHATGAAAAAALVPWLFWLSAAIAALVTLRRGLAPALPVIIAAALPTGWWWMRGDAIPLASLLLVTLMAVVLRARMRWSETLIVATLVAAVMIQIGVFLPPGGAGPLLDTLRQSSPEVGRMLDDLAARGVDTQRMAALLIGGVTGLIVTLASVACLALARSWQAGLYNPGGFRSEFHTLRLGSRELLMLLAIAVVGGLLTWPALAIMSWVPLLVSGVALIHGLIGLKGMNGLWLVAFYALLLTTWPMILIVLLLGLIDTFADFRGRLARSQ